VCPDHLVISEIRTRGVNGGNDEFVELYNPTNKGVALSSSWTLESVSDSGTFKTAWTGTGGIIPAHGHYLVTGADYNQSPAGDEPLSIGLTDAGRLQLVYSPDVFTTDVIDAVCFGFDSATMSELMLLTCEGTPATNPHDDTTASNADRSITRGPRDCTDTDQNDMDFGPQMPATPQNSASPPVVY
jgi:hypothetical protein